MDTIAQMLTTIRNAQMAGHQEVKINASKLKLAVTKILEKEGFVESVHLEQENNLNIIRIDLKYHDISRTKRLPAITGIERVSREGQRVYVKKKEIRKVRNNYGMAIISTSKGVMTGEEAKKLGLGGEYVCKVW
ncbi:MAG TPA: 30S ribosomal protein S8 [Patescibacteria group bacterium]|nr:30S ribosomal protein S8 [Patescibacteria group bacterium]